MIWGDSSPAFSAFHRLQYDTRLLHCKRQKAEKGIYRTASDNKLGKAFIVLKRLGTSHFLPLLSLLHEEDSNQCVVILFVVFSADGRSYDGAVWANHKDGGD